MQKENIMTYYKKVGRRYHPVELHELDSRWTPGLYLIYQTNYASSIEVVRVHKCKSVDLYADMIVAYKEQVIKEVIKDAGKLSLNDLVDSVFESIVKQIENEK